MDLFCFFWITPSCAVATQAIFWIFVAPVNAAMVPLTPDTLPADWTHLRDQWEYSHATRAILQIIGLGAYVLSILAETPQCENLKPHA